MEAGDGTRDAGTASAKPSDADTASGGGVDAGDSSGMGSEAGTASGSDSQAGADAGASSMTGSESGGMSDAGHDAGAPSMTGPEAGGVSGAGHDAGPSSAIDSGADASSDTGTDTGASSGAGSDTGASNEAGAASAQDASQEPSGPGRYVELSSGGDGPEASGGEPASEPKDATRSGPVSGVDAALLSAGIWDVASRASQEEAPGPDGGSEEDVATPGEAPLAEAMEPRVMGQVTAMVLPLERLEEDTTFRLRDEGDVSEL
ncbi:MAG: hypothetical protein EOO72_13905, partial [Myxococcaceae bacterium]